MMQQINRDAAKQFFASYTARYNAEDPKIKLKIDHTYRVADLCDRISQTVSGVEPDLSWLSGMLHDIGRFEQIRRYNTFSDAESVDHAAFGADLLFMDNLIDVFGSYDEYCKDVLETAIRNHNRFGIDTGLSDEYQAYCEILRDADKIDILRVSYETPV
ncbi:MAG: HD domain-containing protein, partial [Lachnospiraceae bacterium]|nr:HD domain-containing protein [Lachnospiraceae bacterium]